MMLTTKLGFDENSYLLWAEQFETFEAEMIKNAGIPIFQNLTQIKCTDERILWIQYHPDKSHKSIKELLSIDFYQNAQTLKLISALLSLEKTCTHHLLNTQHIDFSPKNVLYDMQKQAYIWRYMPWRTSQEHYQMIDLIRHVLIESQQFSTEMYSNYLKEKSIDLESIYKQLQVPSSNTQDGQSLIKRIFKRNQTESAVVTPKTTLHSHMYPILLNKSNPSESHKLYFDLNTIGRDEGCNVLIEGQSISRKHVAIYRDKQHYWVKDLSSTNGTLLNNVPLLSDMPIVNGDNLQIGEKDYIFIR